MADNESIADQISTSSDTVEKQELLIDLLDEKEYDIPPVETPPTLESILNEPDEVSVTNEELLSPLQRTLQVLEDETRSISSSEGLLGDRTPKKTKPKIPQKDRHGSILRYVVLKGVSSQLQSANDRVNAGTPTAMAVARLVAIGMSHGLVLIFDAKQILKWCLGSVAIGSQFGAVSCLSFNKDCTRLLCGFAKGQIMMYDITNGKLLRTITDAHPPSSAILNVKFTDDLTLALSSDSGGSVFELEFKRLIGIRMCESKCLFSGSHGEVCSLEPLLTSQLIADHPLKGMIIAAMASFSKVIIVTVRPDLQVKFVHRLPGDSRTLPLLAWQFVVIQLPDKGKIVDPVLAFARDHTVYYCQVACRSLDDLKITPLQKTELTYSLLSLTWMNSKSILVLDTIERAHLVDVRSAEELEVMDLSDVELVYSSSFYKSLATGGNVSKALATAGERACYQSMTTYFGQLVLLGTRSVQVLTVRTWQERLEFWAKRQQYVEALSLAQSFCDGSAKGTTDLVGNVKRKKELVGVQMLKILDEFVEASLNELRPKTNEFIELQDYYQTVIPVFVDTCIFLDKLDILYDRVYERISGDAIARPVFLECLEHYLLAGRLTTLRPSVAQDFVAHYERCDLLHNLESCLCVLDISCLDLHQVINLCWTRGLYDALFHIFNHGMLDYVSPLDEILQKLLTATSTGKQLTDDQIRMGNKLLVYISCCLAGRGYPFGEIPSSLVSTVKDEVFKCITCLHSKNAPTDEPVYPYLKALLHFNTREFFNVLALALEDDFFTKNEGPQRKQRIVDILLYIMVESIGFTPTQVSSLFTFLARQLARNNSSIRVNTELFDQVVETLCRSEDEARRGEREQALLELLQTGGLQHFREDTLINLAEEAQFYHVCEWLYEKRGQYDKMLQCYLSDPYGPRKAFTFIKRIMSGSNYTNDEKMLLRLAVVQNLETLVVVDVKSSARLLLAGFAGPLLDAISWLQAKKRSLFELLAAIFILKDKDIVPGSEVTTQLESEIYDLYISLMCEFQPSEVTAFLKDDCNYNPDKALEICQKSNNNDASAYLLEKLDRLQEAFNLLINSLKIQLDEMIEVASAYKHAEEEEVNKKSLERVANALKSITQLCKRASGKLPSADREKLWLPVMDLLLTAQRKLKENSTDLFASELRDMTTEMLNSMMGYMSLSVVLQKILKDPVYSKGTLGNLKDLLHGMFETYNYETTVLSTCNRLANRDLSDHLWHRNMLVQRGIACQPKACGICAKLVGLYSVSSLTSDSVVWFRCGHGYHFCCLQQMLLKNESTNNELFITTADMAPICVLCEKQSVGMSPSSVQVSNLPSPKPTLPSTPISPTLLPEQQSALESLNNSQALSNLSLMAKETKFGKKSGNQGWLLSSSQMQNEHLQLKLARPKPDLFVSPDSTT